MPAMTPPLARFTAADYIRLCRAALRAAEEAADAASARRHAYTAMRIARLGEKQAWRKATRQRRGCNSN